MSSDSDLDDWENFDSNESSDDTVVVAKKTVVKGEEDIDKFSWDEPEQKVTKSDVSKNNKKKADEEKKAKEVEEKKRLEKISSYNYTEQELKNMQEESDLQHAKDLFGDIDDFDIPAPNMANMIADYSPRTKEDFDTFSQIIADRVTPFITSTHYRDFVSSLTKKIIANLSIDDMQDIVSDLNKQINQEITKSRGKKGRGKKTKKANVVVKKQAQSKDPFGFDGEADEDYYDDDDFM